MSWDPGGKPYFNDISTALAIIGHIDGQSESSFLFSSARRGTMWAGGTAPASTPVNQTTKDTRPLRDRQFQTIMRQDIFNYLKSSGLDISMATLQNIQGKDYRAIFDFLVLMLDPAHPLNSNARFDEEFVPALKALRYPFAHHISDKWLAAPASMHSWPSLLGVLHWLVDLCKVRHRSVYLNLALKLQFELRDEHLLSHDPIVMIPANVKDEFDDPWDHRTLTFDYFDQAYTLWLDNIDEFVEPNQNLETRYGLLPLLYCVVSI